MNFKEFKPINYLGAALALVGIWWNITSESTNAIIMASPMILIIIGIYLTIKGRKI